MFTSEHYREFRRKVRDFALTLALFSIVAAVTARLSGSFAANLLRDVSIAFVGARTRCSSR